MQAGYKFLVRMLCGLCLVGGFAACQKVDLPSEEGEDTEQPGQTGDKPGNEGHEPGGADEPEDEVPLPPEYEGAWTVAGILSEYEGVDLDTDYEEMVVGYIVGACDGTMKNALFTIDEIRAAGVNTNLLIADSKDERDASRCMPIELKKREFEIKLENSQLSVIDKVNVNGGLLFKKAVCCNSRQGVGYKVIE